MVAQLATTPYKPYGKEPLSATDQVIKDSVDMDDLKRRVTPPTPEIVQKRIDKINGVAADGTVGTGAPVAAAPAVAGKKAAAPKAATPKLLHQRSA